MSTPAGRTLVVTGAGGGIGRALAVGFSHDGARVAGLGRGAADLEETGRLCAEKAFLPVVGDVARPDDVERLFEAAEASFGSVDVLVNNAGVFPHARFVESDWSDWTGAIDTNLLGAALCIRRALPGMLERGFGRIVNITSLAGEEPLRRGSAYSVSKAALIALTRSVAKEINRKRYPDLLVNNVHPGPTRTSMNQEGQDPAAVYPHVRFVVALPRGGPTGQTFRHSRPHPPRGLARLRWLRRSD